MAKKAVIDIGATNGKKFARFAPEGDPDWFRRYLRPYGKCFHRHGAPRDVADYFVKLDAAWHACGMLQTRKVELQAKPEIPKLLKAAAWHCNIEGLFPYQVAGAEHLHSHERVLLADQMGLGKGVQAVAAIDASMGTLAIVPSVVSGNWYKERRWRPELTFRIWQRPYSFFPAPGEVNIVTYPQLPKEMMEARTRCPWCNKLSVVPLEDEEVAALARENKPWTDKCEPGRGGQCKDANGEPRVRRLQQRSDAWPEWVWIGDKPKYPVQLIVDESHYCKSKNSQRTIAVRTIATQCTSVWELTGTPLLNQPPELWSLCELFPGQGGQYDNGAWDTFGSWSEFVAMFEGKKNMVRGIQRGYEWKPGAATPEARERLSSVMLRRMRVDVLPDLPTKTRRIVDVNINERELSKLVTMTENELLQFQDWSDDEVLEQCAAGGALSTIRKELATLKLETMTSLIKEYESVEEPVIAFSYHRGPIEELGRRKGWACITGSVSDYDRTLWVEKFQRGELRGIAGTIGAMGVGVTLTKSANVMFLDRDFVPANNLQAEDRSLRIGQTRGVIVTILNATHPVDQRVAIILERKERLLEAMQLNEEPVSS